MLLHRLGLALLAAVLLIHTAHAAGVDAPFGEDFGLCNCDLTEKACDVGCCCDPDCSNKQIDAFKPSVGCLPEGPVDTGVPICPNPAEGNWEDYNSQDWIVSGEPCVIVNNNQAVGIFYPEDMEEYDTTAKFNDAVNDVDTSFGDDAEEREVLRCDCQVQRVNDVDTSFGDDAEEIDTSSSYSPHSPVYVYYASTGRSAIFTIPGPDTQGECDLNTLSFFLEDSGGYACSRPVTYPNANFTSACALFDASVYVDASFMESPAALSMLSPSTVDLVITSVKCEYNNGSTGACTDAAGNPYPTSPGSSSSTSTTTSTSSLTIPTPYVAGTQCHNALKSITYTVEYSTTYTIESVSAAVTLHSFQGPWVYTFPDPSYYTTPTYTSYTSYPSSNYSSGSNSSSSGPPPMPPPPPAFNGTANSTLNATAPSNSTGFNTTSGLNTTSLNTTSTNTTLTCNCTSVCSVTPANCSAPFTGCGVVCANNCSAVCGLCEAVCNATSGACHVGNCVAPPPPPPPIIPPPPPPSPPPPPPPPPPPIAFPGDTSVTQTFSVTYEPAGKNIRYRSGNPGYIVGKPVLAGVRDGSKIIVSDDVSGMLTYNAGAVDGTCETEGGGLPVLFGYDVDSGCSIDLGWTDFYDCDALRARILSALTGALNVTHVGMWGGSDPDEVDDWVSISLPAFPSSDPVGSNNGECSSIITDVKYEFLYVNQGALLNPQAKIVAARVEYGTSSRLSLDCSTGACSATSTETVSVPLRATVSFVRALADDPREVFPPVPPFLPAVPDDFFYPFYFGNSAAANQPLVHVVVAAAAAVVALVMS